MPEHLDPDEASSQESWKLVATVLISAMLFILAFSVLFESFWGLVLTNALLIGVFVSFERVLNTDRASRSYMPFVLLGVLTVFVAQFCIPMTSGIVEMMTGHPLIPGSARWYEQTIVKPAFLISGLSVFAGLVAWFFRPRPAPPRPRQPPRRPPSPSPRPPATMSPERARAKAKSRRALKASRK